MFLVIKHVKSLYRTLAESLFYVDAVHLRSVYVKWSQDFDHNPLKKETRKGNTDFL